MMYPLVTDLADEGIPVAVTCRVLGFSRQGYFKWRAKPIYDRDFSDAYLINDAIDAHNDDPGFGYRFISDKLEALGHDASENRVQRLCSLQGIWSVHSKKRGLNRKPGPPVHDDLVQRNFSAANINELWLTDISEHPTGEGKLYLCAVKDACSTRIVGYSMDARMPAALAVDALNNALRTRDAPHAIIHTDAGSQGAINWSSQHLDSGGGRWRQCGNVSERSSSIEVTFLRQGGQELPGEKIESSFGRPLLAA
jgi:putative transposase